MDIDTALRDFAAAARDDIAVLVMAASRAMGARVLSRLDPDGSSGVRLAHIPVFTALDPGGTRIGDLADRIGVTRQATAGLVRDLESAGMVATAPDEADRRATRVRLTPQGADFCHRATALVRERERELAEALGEDELRRVKEALRELAAG